MTNPKITGVEIDGPLWPSGPRPDLRTEPEGPVPVGPLHCAMTPTAWQLKPTTVVKLEGGGELRFDSKLKIESFMTELQAAYKEVARGGRATVMGIEFTDAQAMGDFWTGMQQAQAAVRQQRDKLHAQVEEQRRAEYAKAYPNPRWVPQVA